MRAITRMHKVYHQRFSFSNHREIFTTKHKSRKFVSLPAYYFYIALIVQHEKIIQREKRFTFNHSANLI